MALPPESIAVRDSVLRSNDTTMIPTTYGEYSPLFPNPVICVKEIISTAFLVVYKNLIPWNGVGQWLSDTWTWHYLATYISSIDIFYIILSALFFTALRFVLYKTLLERIPKWYGLAPDETEKFPEAAFRTIAYTVLWILSCISLSKTNQFFRPISSWLDWVPGTPIPVDIYLIYILQLGFYIHMIYATTYIETVRKDYFVQMIHHVLTLALLGYSFALRIHLIGLFVLFIHDIADISLELAKTFLYFKTMNGVTYKLPEHLANIVFAMFVLQWILFRLYWYPVKLLYITSHVSFHYYPDTPFYLLPNFMLWVLYGLHVYWFKFIAKLVIKVIVGEELTDNRDYEDNKNK